MRYFPALLVSLALLAPVVGQDDVWLSWSEKQAMKIVSSATKRSLKSRGPLSPHIDLEMSAMTDQVLRALSRVEQLRQRKDEDFARISLEQKRGLILEVAGGVPNALVFNLRAYYLFGSVSLKRRPTSQIELNSEEAFLEQVKGDKFLRASRVLETGNQFHLVFPDATELLSGGSKLRLVVTGRDGLEARSIKFKGEFPAKIFR